MKLGDDEYIGYTLHYSCSDDFNTVAAHLKEKASAGSKFRFGIFPRAHENFIFVRAEEKTTKIAVQCLLRRDELLSRFTPKVCFHKEVGNVRVPPHPGPQNIRSYAERAKLYF